MHARKDRDTQRLNRLRHTGTNDVATKTAERRKKKNLGEGLLIFSRNQKQTSF